MRLELVLLAALSLGSLPGLALAQVYPAAVMPDSLQDPEMKALRRAMIAGDDLGKLSLRRLADAGDGLAAFKFADRLAQDGGKWSDIAHYYAIALYTGRDFVTLRLVSLIKAHDGDIANLSSLRRKSLEDALLAAAARDNRDAALALSDLYLDGAAFGEKPDRAARLLTPYAQAGDGAAALKIALIAIGSDPAAPKDGETARAMLTLALTGDDLAAASMAKNLLPLLPAVPEPEGATP
jgi:hypothetical protein